MMHVVSSKNSIQKGAKMATIDYTTEATTFSGHFSSLSYILQCAKEDLINLLKEIDDFKP